MSHLRELDMPAFTKLRKPEVDFFTKITKIKVYAVEIAGLAMFLAALGYAVFTELHHLGWL